MQANETTLEVTELPIRRWTQDYKEFLETLIKPEDKGAALLTDYREHHSGSHVHFSLQASFPPRAHAVLSIAQILDARLCGAGVPAIACKQYG